MRLNSTALAKKAKAAKKKSQMQRNNIDFAKAVRSQRKINRRIV